MYKEIIITIIILGIVITGDVISQRYTKKSVEDVKYELSILRKNIIEKEDKEKTEKLIIGVTEKWYDYQKNLVYYLEHDELEKVVTQLSEIKGKIDVNQLDESVPEIDKCEFILDHIVEKETFNFKNIF